MSQDRRPAEVAVVAASMLKLWVLYWLGLRPKRPNKVGYVGSRPGFGV